MTEGNRTVARFDDAADAELFCIAASSDSGRRLTLRDPMRLLDAIYENGDDVGRPS